MRLLALGRLHVFAFFSIGLQELVVLGILGGGLLLVVAVVAVVLVFGGGKKKDE
jgi:hypothetical protein